MKKHLSLPLIAILLTGCQLAPVTQPVPIKHEPQEIRVVVDVVYPEQEEKPKQITKQEVKIKRVICRNQYHNDIMEIKRVDKEQFRSSTNIEGYTLAMAKAYTQIISTIEKYQQGGNKCN